SRPTLSGRPVILIDDVITTGATLTAATNFLLAAGSGPVYGLALERVLQKDYPCVRAIFWGHVLWIIEYGHTV
ncbi:MAG: hypothetical protein VW553_05265, partial [Alphaproteobacteria bacterium]